MGKNPNNLSGTMLVFGGAGFIGSNFIRSILSRNKEVNIVNIDLLTYSGDLQNLKDVEKNAKYKFIKGDVSNTSLVSRLVKKYAPDYIINFAAETHVDKSIHVGAKEFIETNIFGVYNILEAIKTSPVKKYVQVSTDEVYGSLPLDTKKRFSELSSILPNAPYAATKAGGDLLCNAYYSTWKLPVVVTHCSNNYGPYQYPEKLIPFFVLRMIEDKKLPMYGDGKNVRDWIHVEDHCRALELCLLKGKPGEIYNIGANNEKNNLEIADMILSLFGRDRSWLEFISDRPGHDRRYAINNSKIKRELGWKPLKKFETEFKKTVDWYIKNPKWINHIRKKTNVFNPHIDLWKKHKIK